MANPASVGERDALAGEVSMRLPASVAASVLLLAPLAIAQSQPPPVQAPPSGEPSAPSQQPIFRAGVDLIEVDVGVIDRSGRPIRDLLAPEFSVTVDGKPRRVVTAEFISLRAPAAFDRRRAVESSEASISTNTERVRGRLIMIAVDRESITFGSGRNATTAASAFLEKLGPTDLVAFMTVPQPGPFVDFTSNHGRVRTELDRTVGLGQPVKGMTLNIGVDEAIQLVRGYDPRLERELLNRFCGQFAPNTTAYLDCVADVHAEAVGIVQQVEHRTHQSIGTLETILRALSDLEGPKSLVWISEGLILERTGIDASNLDRLAAAANTTVHVLLLDREVFDASEAVRSPTVTRDRNLEESGLEILAGYTRGSLHRVVAGAEFVFDRIEEEISGYYLLGVESLETDADGRRHDLKVSVRRQNATVRARREFRAPEKGANFENARESIARALRSPFAVTTLPLRMATYAYKGEGDSKIQVVVTTEIDGAGAAEKSDVTLGYLLQDADGKVILNNLQTNTLARRDGPRGPVFEHAALMTVEPGTYTLKLAAVDASGRRGSIEHPLSAWQMAGVPFATSDLILGDAPEMMTGPPTPHVEARLEGDRLGAYMELYGTAPAVLDAMTVRLEVARDVSGSALASVPGFVTRAGVNRRVVSAVTPIGALTPGRYVARVIVNRADQKVWESARPFYVTPASTAAGLSAVGSRLMAPTAFERGSVLTPETLDAAMDALERGRPALAATAARVRKGELAGAARQAFDANDQTAALFLRGLELYASGDLNRAATQMSEVMRLSPDFTPAALYFGACFAAGGRDREAVEAWRKIAAGKDRFAVLPSLTADAMIRLGDTGAVVDLLTRAVADWPNDDGLRRRLALAHSVAGRYSEAFATVEPLLSRDPQNLDALFVALHALYASHLAGQPVPGVGDARARMAKYGQAYVAGKGPHAELVSGWMRYIASTATQP
jgi:VWFA-related protein